ncbi:DUF2752 domain-containing protein [Phycicoccus duodecadis]|uniref:Uncharacterized protein DUF2752 n=1 Tax=Phycicoccus duodecadis TaxID=173053 RepID=A0A2N3YIF1_9MICO|nr:DUF2752 domain-containing protein [Phycicoccus duodecadis]PKW26624.1 uncharacterized protein DUF2752 [Phycicoccus duodecadis]
MTSVQERVRPLLDTSSRGRRLLRPLAVAAAAAGVLAVVATVDPNESGHYPTCPWLYVTGTWCPGCGTLRALHALTHGDVPTALARNPFTVVASAGLAVWFVVWTHRMWTGAQRTRMAPAWLLYGLFWAVLAFWVARNIPGWTWLSPS